MFPLIPRLVKRLPFGLPLYTRSYYTLYFTQIAYGISSLLAPAMLNCDENHTSPLNDLNKADEVS